MSLSVHVARMDQMERMMGILTAKCVDIEESIKRLSMGFRSSDNDTVSGEVLPQETVEEIHKKSEQKEIVHDVIVPRNTGLLISQIYAGTFNPKDELEYDDLIHLWEQKARHCGQEQEFVKAAICHLGEEGIRDRIFTHQLDKMEDYEEFKDELAKLLFPKEAAIYDVFCQLAQKQPIRSGSAENAVKNSKKLRLSYERLAKRWNWPVILPEIVYNRATYFRLPEQIQKQVELGRLYQEFNGLIPSD